MTTKKTIELNDLLAPLEVTLNGKPIRVIPVSGVLYQELRNIDMEGDALAVYEFARKCVPDLTPEEVYRLTPTQIKAILAVASERISEVEALFPNLTAPTETPAQPSAT